MLAVIKRVPKPFFTGALAAGPSFSSLKRLAKSASQRRIESPPATTQLADLFYLKVEQLEDTLNATRNITTEAIPILRSLIDGVILHPGRKRGEMTIEVHGEPSALFLQKNGKPPIAQERMITVVAEERIRRNHPFLKFEV